MVDPRQALRNAFRKSQERDRTDEALMAVGVLEAHLQELRNPQTLAAAEFRVFSQYGEDGAIQHLLRHVDVPVDTFVEIGVESYRESNTRFLAMKDNWRGLAVDGGRDHVEFLAESELGWRHDIQPIQAFVTRENINALIADAGYGGQLGLLSIDVDGMDYWLWDAIDVVSPAIVVIEYNSVFGPELSVTVPYEASFVCRVAHWSCLYFGASLQALTDLALARGYSLVGASVNAVNAFYVRDDLLGDLRPVDPQQAWRPSRFLSSREPSGGLSRVRRHEDRLRVIQDLPILDLRGGDRVSIRDIYKLDI